MTTPNITTLVFDCFGVICTSVLSDWYNENSLKYGFVEDNLKDILRKLDLGHLTEENVYEHFSKYNGVTSTKEEIQNNIDERLGVDNELLTLIKQLKQKGFKTALLSNGNYSFFERKIFADYPEFKEAFDALVISSVVGMVKPDADIYLHALQQIQSKPEEALFADDNKENVDAATKLGLHGYVYTDVADFKKHLSTIGVQL